MVTQNSINNTITDNNFSVNLSTAATTLLSTVEHSDNTSSTSSAAQIVKTGGASGGDPYIRFSISTLTDFSIGIDNSVGDDLKIGPNANPSTGTSSISIDSTSGAVKFAEAFEFPIADGSAGQILITDGVGNLDWGSKGGILPWQENTSGPVSLTAGNGYISNSATRITYNLPVTASLGDVFWICGKGTGGWQVAQNSGQTIHFLSNDTTTGVSGEIESTGQYDVLKLLCITADTDFVVIDSMGNITVV
jgi:hypothetical protein